MSTLRAVAFGNSRAAARERPAIAAEASAGRPPGRVRRPSVVTSRIRVPAAFRRRSSENACSTWSQASAGATTSSGVAAPVASRFTTHPTRRPCGPAILRWHAARLSADPRSACSAPSRWPSAPWRRRTTGAGLIAPARRSARPSPSPTMRTTSSPAARGTASARGAAATRRTSNRSIACSATATGATSGVPAPSASARLRSYIATRSRSVFTLLNCTSRSPSSVPPLGM
jgi:hypothetical protein